MVVGSGIVYSSVSIIAYKYLTHGSDELVQVREETKNGFSYIDNPQRNKIFQDVADVYDSQIGKDETVMGINWLRWALLRTHAKGTVLEVAAGTGRNISHYPKAVDRVVLLDSSRNMLLQAKDKISQQKDENGKRFATMEADATNLSFPDSCFDTVVDTFGLCSYVDPVTALNEMARVCKPNGKILLLEHGRSKKWSSLSEYLDKHGERHAKNWGSVWNRDMDQILEDAGVVLDCVDTWHFGTTYYVVCRPKGKPVASNGILAAQHFPRQLSFPWSSSSSR